MRFIHMADIHLGASPDSGKPWSRQRSREIWNSFQRVIETAGRERTDLLLISGDLFHRQPLIRELKEVNGLFASIPHTRVVMIAGNHDYVKRDSAYLRCPWAENVTGLWEGSCQKVSFPELETQVYGISYRQREIDTEAYRNLQTDGDPGFSVLMMHGDEAHLPLAPQQIKVMGFSYLALGHIHKPGRLNQRAAYPGSLEPTDKNDLGRHGYIRGAYENGHLSLAFVPAACREYVPLEIAVNGNTTGYELVRRVEQETQKRGSQNLYKITLKGLREPGLEFSPGPLEEVCNLADFCDETRPNYDFEELHRQYAGSLVGDYLEHFAHCQDPVEKAALFEGLQARMEAGA